VADTQSHPVVVKCIIAEAGSGVETSLEAFVRFRKSLKIMPGVRVNLSKSGVSTSFGGRGATVNVSKRGVRSTLSVPGTGLSWSSMSGWAEGKQSLPADEIEHLRRAAVKAIGDVAKEAEKTSGIETKINRAISTLNGGRGLTHAKVQTFEKRIFAEEERVSNIEAMVREKSLFLEAIEVRLRAMKFGFFSGGDKRHRDRVVEAVAVCSREAREVVADFRTSC